MSRDDEAQTGSQRWQVHEFVKIGNILRDRMTDQVGRVMGQEGPYYQLRSLNGGREWDVHPESLEVVTLEEALRASTKEANRASEANLWLGP